ncbi:MAG: DUF4256 domain-containing protein [Flammeovirgaceae bacterium]
MKKTSDKKELPPKERDQQLKTLRARFEKDNHRHASIQWADVEARLTTAKLWSLHQMESTGGEPDVVAFDKKTGEYVYFDCSPETPVGRRSFCYDREAWEGRKENKPKSNAYDEAAAMGIALLNEEQYRELQKIGKFDTKTSSWLQTPDNIRKLGGAIFGDYRYGQVFIYHNGAESYYGARGFRGALRV